MPIDVAAFWSMLKKDQNELTAQERGQAMCVANSFIHMWETFDEGTKAKAMQVFDTLFSYPGAYNKLLIDSLRFQLTKDLTFLKTIPAHIDGHPDDLSACASSFMSLSDMVFNDTEHADIASIIDRRVLRSLFEKMLKRVTELYDRFAVNRTKPFSRNDKVVVLTPQFLTPPHAPTVHAINFAVALIEEFGKEVMIVASSEYSIANEGAIAPGIKAATVPEYVGGLKQLKIRLIVEVSG